MNEVFEIHFWVDGKGCLNYNRKNMHFLSNVITYWIFIYHCQIRAFSSCLKICSFMLMILFNISCDNEKVKNLAKSNYCFTCQKF